MEKVELKFLRITYSHTHAGAYALILAEVKGDRRLPIIIGGAFWGLWVQWPTVCKYTSGFFVG